MIKSSLLKQSCCLMLALSGKDEYTGTHSKRVELLALKIGMKCGLTLRELIVLRAAAKLHDVGKISIPDRILLKPSSFDEDEWAVMKTHAEFGEKICETIPHQDGKVMATIIRHHHEYFNGDGYPDALSGERIPVSARIISVVDSYDAMATARPYHKSRSHQEVMEILRSESGKKIDPYMLGHLESVIEHSEFMA